MWDVLSGDFDESISPDQCTLNVIGNAKQGSIIVFHDSEKAFSRMSIALSKALQFFVEKGYNFEMVK